MNTHPAITLSKLRGPLFLSLFVLGIGILLIITQPWRLGHSASAEGAEADETAQAAEPEPEATNPAITHTSLETRWGIQFAGLRLSAGGTLLDFRYSVLDPNKAAAMLKQEAEHTYLIDEAKGTKLPLGNANRSGTLHRAAKELIGGHTYFMYFPNPGRQLTSGNKVTLVMGDFRAQNLFVE